IDALASGTSMADEVAAAVAKRKLTLNQVEAELARAKGQGVSLKDFRRKIRPLLKTWREYLRSNPDRAQWVLRKILPTRVKVTPNPARRSWTFNAKTNYDEVLKELGLDCCTEKFFATMVEPAFANKHAKVSSKGLPQRWPAWPRRSA